MAQNSTFAGRQYLTGSFEACAATAADFDHDGHEDFAVAHYFGKVISILLGNTAGGLDLKTTMPLQSPTDIQSMAAGDFNTDGKLDLVLSEVDLFYFGNGDGTFGAPVYKNVSEYRSAIATADVNNDGKLDLVVTQLGTAKLGVLPGNGLGDFGSAILVPTTGLRPAAVALGDLDQDGKIDAATANEGAESSFLDGSVTFFKNQGLGVLANTSNVAVGARARDIALADLDKDGHLDAASVGYASNPNSGNVSWIRGNGTGSIAPPVVLASGVDSSKVKACDVSSDGWLDLLGLDDYDEKCFVMLGNASGGFRRPVFTWDGGDAVDLFASDVNGDGRLDLAVVDYEAVTVLGGNGLGVFAPPPLELGGPAWAPQLADVNVDGSIDLVSLIPSAGKLCVNLGLGSGDFQKYAHFPVGSAPSELEICDLDGDGLLDALVAHGSNGFSVVKGDGTGAFAAQPGTPTGGYVYNALARDVNGDGAPDVLTLLSSTPPLRRYLNDGTGSFGPFASYPLGSHPTSFTTGDVNEDGELDAVGGGVAGASFAVALGNGSGGFGPPAIVSSGGSSSVVTLGDVNEDGHADVLTGTSFDYVNLYLGAGTGSYGTAKKLLTGTQPFFEWITDVTCDGRPDVVTVNYGDFTATILEGASSPSVVRHDYIASWHADACIGDLDTDGRIDLLTTANLDPTALRMFNLSQQPAGVSSYGTGTGGCRGQHGMVVTKNPRVGIGQLEVECTGAPPLDHGELIVGDAADFAGTISADLGVLLHLDMLGGNVVQTLVMGSDGVGLASATLSIGNDPALAGKTLYMQSFWLWTGCKTGSPFGYSSSRGLEVKISW